MSKCLCFEIIVYKKHLFVIRHRTYILYSLHFNHVRLQLTMDTKQNKKHKINVLLHVLQSGNVSVLEYRNNLVPWGHFT